MAKFTNAQIAGNLDLWNEYFNTFGFMTDEEFHAMSYDDRLAMLNTAYPDEDCDGDCDGERDYDK